MSLQPWFLLDLVKGEQGGGERQRSALAQKRWEKLHKHTHTQIQAGRLHWQFITPFSTPLPHQALSRSPVDGSGPYRTAPLSLTHGSVKPTVSIRLLDPAEHRLISLQGEGWVLGY